MKYSKPAKRVKLISFAENGMTIDDLLTEKIAPKLMWLKQGVTIGDSRIDPATPLFAMYEERGFSSLFDDVDLEPIEADGLENLHKIGGDADGHEYVVGLRSRQFYVLWRDMEFELVAKSTKSFLQWVIRKRSHHFEGCPWAIFTTGTKQTLIKTVWHRDQVDPAPILEKAKELFAWDREHISPLGFELFNRDAEITLRFDKVYPCVNSHVKVAAAKKPPKLETFLRWLKRRGFGQDWD